MSQETPKTGRPTVYTDELGELVEDLMTSGMSLRRISQRPDMPGLTTLHRWKDEPDHPFRVHYARGKANRTETHAEMVTDNALDCVSGTIDPNTCKAANDGLKWAAGQMQSPLDKAGGSWNITITPRQD